jgi:hypothetical protein
MRASSKAECFVQMKCIWRIRPPLEGLVVGNYRIRPNAFLFPASHQDLFSIPPQPKCFNCEFPKAPLKIEALFVKREKDAHGMGRAGKKNRLINRRVRIIMYSSVLQNWLENQKFFCRMVEREEAACQLQNCWRVMHGCTVRKNV